MATRKKISAVAGNLFHCIVATLMTFTNLADLAGNSWLRLIRARVVREEDLGMSKSLKRTTTLKKKGKSKSKKPSSSWQPTLKHYFGGKVSRNVVYCP
jgi:hypothetical protein